MKDALGEGREGVRATQSSSVRRTEAWLRINNVGPLGTRTEAGRASDRPGLRVRGGTGVFEGPRGGAPEGRDAVRLHRWAGHRRWVSPR